MNLARDMLKRGCSGIDFDYLLFQFKMLLAFSLLFPRSLGEGHGREGAVCRTASALPGTCFSDSLLISLPKPRLMFSCFFSLPFFKVNASSNEWTLSVNCRTCIVNSQISSCPCSLTPGSASAVLLKIWFDPQKFYEPVLLHVSKIRKKNRKTKKISEVFAM